MKTASVKIVWLTLLFVGSLFAQSQVTANSPVVPRLVNFSGRVTGDQVSAVAGVTFAIYQEQYGGSPLWMETQHTQLDAKGNYTVQLGATSSQGLPLELFSSGQARWLGVRVNGGEEQSRVLLLSVPYALKAADAQTLNGLPASAFALAGSQLPNPAPSTATAAATNSGAPTVGGTGTQNYIPLWTDNNGDLGNSILYQTGTGSSAKIGINEKNPIFTLDVNGQELVRGLFEMATQNYATKNKAYNSNPLNFESSAFNSTTGKYTLNHFQWQAEPTGNNTSTPGATLNLLYGTDPASPAETGLSLNPTGQFTFAPGQTFPGTGTITGVTTASGSGLSGGGSSGNLNLGLVNTCAANQVLQWNGSAWACSSAGSGTITGVTAGTGLVGGGTSGNVTLNADSSKVAFLANPNTFTKPVTIQDGGASTALVISSMNEGINATMSGNIPYVAAIQGINSATGAGNTFGVFGGSSTDSGGGVWGESSGAAGSGVFGQGTGAGTTGVYGESDSGNGVYGLATSNTAAGVYGTSLTGNGTGVYGAATANGIAVYGHAPNGYGFDTDSNVHQDRAANGWVKAMVYVDYVNQPPVITRCYNSTLTGPAASAPPCGFSALPVTNNVAVLIDFHFEVNDRFLMAQASFVGAPLLACVDTDTSCSAFNFQPTDNQVLVSSKDVSNGNVYANKFYLFIY